MKSIYRQIELETLQKKSYFISFKNKIINLHENCTANSVLTDLKLDSFFYYSK